MFGCKEYNQSDFSIDLLVMSLCRAVSCVVGRGCSLWPGCSLGKTLLAFALLHFVLQGQTCLLLQVSLDSTFAFQSPMMKRTSFFGVMKAYKAFIEPFNFSFFSISAWGIGLDYCDIECFALGMTRDHFWDCTQVLHFWLLLTVRATPFLLRDSCPQ